MQFLKYGVLGFSLCLFLAAGCSRRNPQPVTTNSASAATSTARHVTRATTSEVGSQGSVATHTATYTQTTTTYTQTVRPQVPGGVKVAVWRRLNIDPLTADVDRAADAMARTLSLSAREKADLVNKLRRSTVSHQVLMGYLSQTEQQRLEGLVGKKNRAFYPWSLISRGLGLSPDLVQRIKREQGIDESVYRDATLQPGEYIGTTLFGNIKVQSYTKIAENFEPAGSIETMRYRVGDYEIDLIIRCNNLAGVRAAILPPMATAPLPPHQRMFIYKVRVTRPLSEAALIKIDASWHDGHQSRDICDRVDQERREGNAVNVSGCHTFELELQGGNFGALARTPIRRNGKPDFPLPSGFGSDGIGRIPFRICNGRGTVAIPLAYFENRDTWDYIHAPESWRHGSGVLHYPQTGSLLNCSRSQLRSGKKSCKPNPNALHSEIGAIIQKRIDDSGDIVARLEFVTEVGIDPGAM